MLLLLLVAAAAVAAAHCCCVLRRPFAAALGRLLHAAAAGGRPLQAAWGRVHPQLDSHVSGLTCRSRSRPLLRLATAAAARSGSSLHQRAGGVQVQALHVQGSRRCTHFEWVMPWDGVHPGHPCFGG